MLFIDVFFIFLPNTALLSDSFLPSSSYQLCMVIRVSCSSFSILPTYVNGNLKWFPLPIIRVYGFIGRVWLIIPVNLYSTTFQHKLASILIKKFHVSNCTSVKIFMTFGDMFMIIIYLFNNHMLYVCDH